MTPRMAEPAGRPNPIGTTNHTQKHEWGKRALLRKTAGLNDSSPFVPIRGFKPRRTVDHELHTEARMGKRALFLKTARLSDSIPFVPIRGFKTRGTVDHEWHAEARMGKRALFLKTAGLNDSSPFVPIRGFMQEERGSHCYSRFVENMAVDTAQRSTCTSR
jgi:hypothetical protein